MTLNQRQCLVKISTRLLIVQIRFSLHPNSTSTGKWKMGIKTVACGRRQVIPESFPGLAVQDRSVVILETQFSTHQSLFPGYDRGGSKK